MMRTVKTKNNNVSHRFKKTWKQFLSEHWRWDYGPYLTFGQHTAEDTSSDSALVPSCSQQTSTMFQAHLDHSFPHSFFQETSASGSVWRVFCYWFSRAKALIMCRKTKELKWVVFAEKGAPHIHQDLSSVFAASLPPTTFWRHLGVHSLPGAQPSDRKQLH